MTDSAIPKGSTVLITGATGYLGAQTASLFVNAGYRVRAPVRNQEKGKSLEEAIAKLYGPGKIETTTITDMADPNAYDHAIKGVSAVVHIASDVSFGSDAKAIITSVVTATKGLLKLAAAEPSVKRFVLTSSVVANASDRYAPETWNQQAMDVVYDADPNDPSNGPLVYAASKSFGEKALWDFVEKEKPSFTANTVLPAVVVGKALDAKLTGSTWNFINGFVNGNEQAVGFFTGPLSQGCYVNNEDIARLHLGAATLQDVKNQRLEGVAGTYDINSWIDLFHKIDSSKTLPAKAELKEGKTAFDNHTSLDVLKALGRSDWISEEQSLRDTVAYKFQ